VETLSVKYICKLSALVVLLIIAFLNKVPDNNVIAASDQKPAFTKVNVLHTENGKQLYKLVMPEEEIPVLVNL